MRTLVVLGGLALLMSTTACSGNKQAASPAQGSVAEVKKPAAPAKKADAVVARTERADGKVDYSPIYFEFDSTQLRPDARPRLDTIAETLRRHPGMTLTVEGHADERGTTEYNMALGERRARVVRDYLRSMGVPADRLRTISYGEERPAVAGTDETAWSRNRRSELVPAEPGRPTAAR